MISPAMTRKYTTMVTIPYTTSLVRITCPARLTCLNTRNLVATGLRWASSFTRRNRRRSTTMIRNGRFMRKWIFRRRIAQTWNLLTLPWRLTRVVFYHKGTRRRTRNALPRPLELGSGRGARMPFVFPPCECKQGGTLSRDLETRLRGVPWRPRSSSLLLVKPSREHHS